MKEHLIWGSLISILFVGAVLGAGLSLSKTPVERDLEFLDKLRFYKKDDICYAFAGHGDERMVVIVPLEQCE